MTIDDKIVYGVATPTVAFIIGMIKYFTDEIKRLNRLTAEKDKVIQAAMEKQVELIQESMRRTYGNTDHFNQRDPS